MSDYWIPTKQPEQYKILHIATDHVDFMCLRCRTAFDAEVGDKVLCPFCNKSKLDKE